LRYKSVTKEGMNDCNIRGMFLDGENLQENFSFADGLTCSCFLWVLLINWETS